jgi:glycosyltransferase involved in cell wall biosynthesis
MKIAYLTAGAAGMYCGSCMNDNAVARTLQGLGHDCILVPVYTPIRTDDEDVSVDRVFLGGINVYLQQKLALLSRLPSFFDALLNQPWLIQWATRDAGKTSPALLGVLTESMLKGFRGKQRKEFERLLAWLESDLKPDVVILTNLLIGGAIPELRSRLNASVFVTLQGDDIFLDSLSERDRDRCEALMQGLVQSVNGFLVHSHAYAKDMARRFKIPSSKLHVVPLGISTADFLNPSRPTETNPQANANALSNDPKRPLTIGYLARLAPEKGLHRLVEAFTLLTGAFPQTQFKLRMAGWMGPQHAQYWEQQKFALNMTEKMDIEKGTKNWDWDYAGSVDRQGKLDFLCSLDLFCVPTVYAEPKGRFLLEAVALGLPYVMPDHGAFPEMHARIQSSPGCPKGWLFRHEDRLDLARALTEAIATQPRRIAPPKSFLEEIDMETHGNRLLEILRTESCLPTIRPAELRP